MKSRLQVQTETLDLAVGQLIMNLRYWTISLFAAGQLLAGAVTAEEVYSWVDEDGVTHFSDAKPPGNSAQEGDVETITLLDEFTDTDPDEDYFSVVNQWQRLQSERAEEKKLALERERLRTERLRSERSARQAEAAAAQTRADSHPVVVGSGHPGLLGRRAFHRGHPGFGRHSPRHGRHDFNHSGFHSNKGRDLHHHSRPKHPEPPRRSRTFRVGN